MRMESALAAKLAALSVLLIGDPAHAQTPDPATTPLTGTVTTGDNRTPQAGASVTIPSIGAQAVTDDNGGYTLSVPAGTHTVRVEMPGYYPVERTVTVNATSGVLDVKL